MKKIITLIILFTSLRFWAQDFHLSQYDAAAMNLNPSMTGMFNGYYRIHGHYRTQWSAISTKPFTTAVLSFDKPFKKFNAGAQVLNYRAGAGNFNVFSFLVAAAYDISLDNQRIHRLSVGAQVGIIQTSLDLTRLTYANQYIYTSSGGAFDTNIPSGEPVTRASSTIHDLNAGLTYYFAKKDALLNPFIGFSAFHLTQPNQSLLGNNSKLPFRFNIHGGSKVNITERIQVLPKFLYMDQLNNKEITTTILVHYYLKSVDAYLFGGPTYRNKDAAIVEGGLQYGKFTYRVSYDINTSALIQNTNGRGGLELSVTYIPRAKKPSIIPTCPR